MRDLKLLNQNIEAARGGSADGFEGLYILTYADVYKLAYILAKDEKKAIELLEDVYVSVYENLSSAPSGKAFFPWIQEILYQETEKKTGFREEVPNEIDPETLTGRMPEGKAATVFMAVEERTGILNEEPEPVRWKMWLFSFGKILLTVLTVFVTVRIVSAGWQKGSQYLAAFRSTDDRQWFVSETQSGESAGISAEEENTVIELDGQKVELSSDGQILRVDPDESAEKKNDSIQESGEWTYYLILEDSQEENLENADDSLFHKLFRMKEDNNGTIEVIAEDADDFKIWKQWIFYTKDDVVERADTGASYMTQKLSYHMEMDEKNLYLLDFLGNPVQGETQLEDRVYETENGVVTSIIQYETTEDGAWFYLDDVENSSVSQIWKQSEGRTQIVTDEDREIDGFCVAGEWIYYSVQSEPGEDSMLRSKIFRISLDGSQRQEVHGNFQGRLVRMYYYQSLNEIYAEYEPSPETSGYGRIAVLSMDGQMSYLEDAADRTAYQTTGNDRLQLVMVDGTDVYCFWKDYHWTPGERADEIWSYPLKLSNRTRIFMK